MIARQARAVYDVLAAIVLGEAPKAASLSLACSASRVTWMRVLASEGCGAQVHALLARAEHCSHGRSWPSALPAHVRFTLRGYAEAALRQSLRLQPQLASILEVADREGVRLLALKGAARLLSGRYRELRSTNDIDLLVVQGSAEQLHRALQEHLGYSIRVGAQPCDHHLAPLQLPGSMELELHTRPGSECTVLSELLLEGAREVLVSGHTLLVPAATPLFLHTLEHAVIANWSQRHRLRDLLDMAASWTGEIDAARVEMYVRTSPQPAPLEVSLSAAHMISADVPCMRGDAWRIVRRAGHARAIASATGHDIVGALRLRLVAGVIAEGSTPSIARLVRLAFERPRRLLRTAVAAVAALAAAGCSDGVVTPAPPSEPFPPVPRFVFASNELGADRLYRWNAGVISLIENSQFGDRDPHIAAGKLVFTSVRDGNAEVYIAPASGGEARRLTQNGASDGEARLSPNGERIAFVSTRGGGVHRIWLMNADGSGLDTLATARPDAVAERGPAWSPDGKRIAFTSQRGGTPQVWIVDAAGGVPMQLTRESGGAFEPAWSADGEYILYVEGSGVPRLRRIHIDTGQYESFAFRPGGLGGPSCNGTLCIAAAGPHEGSGAIIAVRVSGGADTVLVGASHGFSSPAFQH